MNVIRVCTSLSYRADDADVILQVDPFELTTARAFFWNAVAFMILLFTNAKVASSSRPAGPSASLLLAQALEAANVEAVIVFRTLSIFVTAYGDFRLLQVRDVE